MGHTRYSVVRYVAKKVFQFKLTGLDSEDWDISWVDMGITPDKL